MTEAPMVLDIRYGTRYLHTAHPRECLVCGVAVDAGDAGDCAYLLYIGESSEPTETCHEQCLP